MEILGYVQVALELNQMVSLKNRYERRISDLTDSVQRWEVVPGAMGRE